MSSHHIVREKQEPALIIAGLDYFDYELLGQLLEWSPTVIVTAHTAEKVQAVGIKIDWLVADEMMDLQQSDIKLIQTTGTDTVITALDHLIAQDYHAVNLITDSFQTTNYFQLFRKINLVIFCQGKKIIAVHSGFSKWKPAGECIEILTSTHDLMYSGLLFISENTYQTERNGFFSLQFTNHYILLAEHI